MVPNKYITGKSISFILHLPPRLLCWLKHTLSTWHTDIYGREFTRAYKTVRSGRTKRHTGLRTTRRSNENYTYFNASSGLHYAKVLFRETAKRLQSETTLIFSNSDHSKSMDEYNKDHFRDLGLILGDTVEHGIDTQNFVNNLLDVGFEVSVGSVNVLFFTT